MSDRLRQRGRFGTLRQIFLPGLPAGVPHPMPIDRLPLAHQKLLDAQGTGRMVVLVLHPGMALERVVELPLAAANHATAAIRLDLTQSLPARARGLIWTESEIGRSDGKAQFRVRIVKEAPVLEAIRELKSVGVSVAAVHIADVASPPVWRLAEVREGSPRTWLLLAALLLLLIVAVQSWRLNARAGEFEDQLVASNERITKLESRLLEAQQAAAESASARDNLSEAASLFRLERQRLPMLTHLGRVLPDEAWISELTISSEQMAISGFTTLDVSSLVADLQSEPWVSSAGLAGSVTHDAYSGQSRFQIVLEVRSAQAGP